MTTVDEALQKISAVWISRRPLPVEVVCAGMFHRELGCEIRRGRDSDTGFRLSVMDMAEDRPQARVLLRRDGSGSLVASHPAFLYAYTCLLLQDWRNRAQKDFEPVRRFLPAFRWHRPLFDMFLNQTWRTARGFDPEQHLRELARAGYTHAEINGLAAPVPLEESAPGEFYSAFYTYCPALDQFVASDLNAGLYPTEYLAANLARLKKMAALCRQYGLAPGLLCFEPRSVPERFFQKYPTLRGPRVDHPYRSRKPRYALALSHPLVKEHYRQLIQRLLREIPELAYLSIWSNDSGAGFEYTASLYVGRNGGPYLLREWRSHEQIAAAAARNIADFLRLLRDAAAEVQPRFRVSLRLEPFREEQPYLLPLLQEGLDVETPSLRMQGYESPDRHVIWRDVKNVAGTIYHARLSAREEPPRRRLEKQGVCTHLIYTQGNGFTFEPILGVPFPWLLAEKLQAMVERGFEQAANLGGAAPSMLVPFSINQEVFRRQQLEPELPVDRVVEEAAARWAPQHPEKLVALWRMADDGVRRMPILPLYSGFGFVWLRLWVRPLVPDLLAVPEAERRYYEDFMVSPANNTNLADLSRDVLFRLFNAADAARFLRRVDRQVLPRLERAVGFADDCLQSVSDAERAVFRDQCDRLSALCCWAATLRTVAAWTVGVYGWLEAESMRARKRYRRLLDEMIDREIANTERLLRLWRESDTHFMAVSCVGETPFIYGENFGEGLQKKIDLMRRYREVEPRIDSGIMWRI